MKHFSHDYTKASEAQNVLFLALENLRNGHTYEAKRDLMKARELLDEYLAVDNMIRDDDVEGGWIRARDTFDEDQMVFIRDIFAQQLDDTTGYGGIIQDMLDVINVVQRATGCDEYEDLDHYRRSQSGSFADIY